jgi:hypothetical protein
MAINIPERLSTVGNMIGKRIDGADNAVRYASIRSFPNRAVSIRTDPKHYQPTLNGSNGLIPHVEMDIPGYFESRTAGVQSAVHVPVGVKGGCGSVGDSEYLFGFCYIRNYAKDGFGTSLNLVFV